MRLWQVFADGGHSDSVGGRLRRLSGADGAVSAHTRYEVFTFHDTTEILDGYLDAWRQENVDLDGVYSGFLGSADQVAIIKRLYAEYPHALRLVDPVMGDGGEIYATYTPELCRAMGTLVMARMR